MVFLPRSRTCKETATIWKTARTTQLLSSHEPWVTQRHFWCQIAVKSYLHADTDRHQRGQVGRLRGIEHVNATEHRQGMRGRVSSQAHAPSHVIRIRGLRGGARQIERKGLEALPDWTMTKRLLS